MTHKQKRRELEATPWAKAFRKDSPISYRQAIDLALDPALRVEVIRTDDRWTIAVDTGDPDFFYLDYRPERDEAIALCQKMGWRLA